MSDQSVESLSAELRQTKFFLSIAVTASLIMSGFALVSDGPIEVQLVGSRAIPVDVSLDRSSPIGITLERGSTVGISGEVTLDSTYTSMSGNRYIRVFNGGN
jgi:hypothetical protein